MKKTMGKKDAGRVAKYHSGTVVEQAKIVQRRPAMHCPRCAGFLVRDHFYDPDGPFLHIETLRCLNCGETVYPKTPKQSDEIPGRGHGKRAPHAA